MGNVVCKCSRFLRISPFRLFSAPVIRRNFPSFETEKGEINKLAVFVPIAAAAAAHFTLSAAARRKFL